MRDNYPDDCQSRTDMSLPWNVEECKTCGTELDNDGACEFCDEEE